MHVAPRPQVRGLPAATALRRLTGSVRSCVALPRSALPPRRASAPHARLVRQTRCVSIVACACLFPVSICDTMAQRHPAGKFVLSMFPMIQTNSFSPVGPGHLQRGRMILPVIGDHPLTSLANLGRKYVRRLARHGSILSGLGVPKKTRGDSNRFWVLRDKKSGPISAHEQLEGL